MMIFGFPVIKDQQVVVSHNFQVRMHATIKGVIGHEIVKCVGTRSKMYFGTKTSMFSQQVKGKSDTKQHLKVRCYFSEESA